MFHRELIYLLIGVSCFGASVGLAGEIELKQTVREAVVAGRFYPGAAVTLHRAVLAYMEEARPAAGSKPLALVSPHAGYVYSGQIAADAYAQAADHEYDLVVVLGTNHTTAGFDGVSIWPEGAYRTPLGEARIDAELAKALTDADDDFEFFPAVHEREHSVEVQLPYIQVLFPDTPVLCAVVGAADADLCEGFGRALARLVTDRRVLIVASSDLSHYPNYDDAVRVDHAVLAALCTLDAKKLKNCIRDRMRENVPGLSTCACGEAPILAMMAAAKELGAKRADLVSYANSGDALVGDRQRVVGYGAVVVTREETEPAIEAPDAPRSGMDFPPLDTGDERWLMRFARETIERYLETETLPLPRDLSPALSRRQGAFVTLNKRGALRGCIGHMADDLPLGIVIGKMALAAAFEDRRFSPVRAYELEQMEIEISLLTPFEPVSGPEDVVIGRDGVVLRKSGHSAVFLPQVAPEQGWGLEETLSRLCLKAGLDENCWTADARLFTFQAEILHESDYH